MPRPQHCLPTGHGPSPVAADLGALEQESGPAGGPGTPSRRRRFGASAAPVLVASALDAARKTWRTRPARHALLAVAALVQAVLVVSAVAYWTTDVAVEAAAVASPAGWVGIVHDVGAAGVNLRSSPRVLPETSRDTAARGSRLQIKCGQSGDVVTGGTVQTPLWLKTSDDLFVSMLYVRMPGRTSIVSCLGQQDAPLLQLPGPDGSVPAPGAPAAGAPEGPALASGCVGVTCGSVPGASTLGRGGAGGGTAPAASPGRVGSGAAKAVTPSAVPAESSSSAYSTAAGEDGPPSNSDEGGDQPQNDGPAAG